MDLLKRRLLDRAAGVPRAVHLRGHAGGRLGVPAARARRRSSPRTLWSMLLRDDDASTRAHAVPLGPAAAARSASSSGRSTRTSPTATRCSTGCPTDWPAGNSIPPYIRDAEDRAHDFGLVNQGYLGYMNLGLHRPRGRPVRVARGAARQAVRGEAVRARASSSPSASEPKGGCPVADPHPADDRADRQRPVPRGPGAHRVVQPAARRHRPGLPAGAAVPGRVRPEQAADRDRPARVVPARSARSWSTPSGAAAALRRAPRPVGGRRPSRRWRSSAPGRPG